MASKQTTGDSSAESKGETGGHAQSGGQHPSPVVPTQDPLRPVQHGSSTAGQINPSRTGFDSVPGAQSAQAITDTTVHGGTQRQSNHSNTVPKQPDSRTVQEQRKSSATSSGGISGQTINSSTGSKSVTENRTVHEHAKVFTTPATLCKDPSGGQHPSPVVPTQDPLRPVQHGSTCSTAGRINPSRTGFDSEPSAQSAQAITDTTVHGGTPRQSNHSNTVPKQPDSRTVQEQRKSSATSSGGGQHPSPVVRTQDPLRPVQHGSSTAGRINPSRTGFDSEPGAQSAQAITDTTVHGGTQRQSNHSNTAPKQPDSRTVQEQRNISAPSSGGISGQNINSSTRSKSVTVDRTVHEHAKVLSTGDELKKTDTFRQGCRAPRPDSPEPGSGDTAMKATEPADPLMEPTRQNIKTDVPSAEPFTPPVCSARPNIDADADVATPPVLPPRSNRSATTVSESTTATGMMSTEVNMAAGWENLKLQIKWGYGSKRWSIDASRYISPVKLQYAVTSRLKEGIEIMDNKNICLSVKENVQEVTFELDGTEFKNCEEVETYVIRTVNEHLLNDLGFVVLNKDTNQYIGVLKSLKHSPPEKVRKGYVRVFKTQSSICLVGKKASFDNVAAELDIAVKQTAVSTGWIHHELNDLSQVECWCLEALQFAQHLKTVNLDVSINFKDREMVGYQQHIDKALAVLSEFKNRLDSRIVKFKHADCAQIFLDKDGKDNDSVCAFVNIKLRKEKLIKASYLHVAAVDEGGSIPRVSVVCRDSTSVEKAINIVSSCVDRHLFKQFDSDEAKRFLKTWVKSNKVQTSNIGLGDQEGLLVICTSDLSSEILDIHDHILATNNNEESFPSPPVVNKFLLAFGEEIILDIEKKFTVRIVIENDKLSIKGRNKNIKEAKTFYIQEMKKRMGTRTLHIPEAIVSQCVSQMDDVIASHECCSTTKYESKSEGQLMEWKNGSCIATWYDPGNQGKVTLVEGNPVELDVELLLLLTSDTLFPLQPDFQENKEGKQQCIKLGLELGHVNTGLSTVHLDRSTSTISREGEEEKTGPCTQDPWPDREQPTDTYFMTSVYRLYAVNLATSIDVNMFVQTQWV